MLERSNVKLLTQCIYETNRAIKEGVFSPEVEKKLSDVVKQFEEIQDRHTTIN